MEPVGGQQGGLLITSTLAFTGFSTALRSREVFYLLHYKASLAKNAPDAFGVKKEHSLGQAFKVVKQI
jgi:hypothetical protein